MHVPALPLDIDINCYRRFFAINGHGESSRAQQNASTSKVTWELLSFLSKEHAVAAPWPVAIARQSQKSGFRGKGGKSILGRHRGTYGDN